MLTTSANKMLRPDAAHTKAAGPPPPDAAWGECPACGARGPITHDTRGGKTRPAVHTCRCLKPPTPTPVSRPTR